METINNRIETEKKNIEKFFKDNEIKYCYIDEIESYRSKDDTFYIIVVCERLLGSLKTIEDHENFWLIMPYTNRHLAIKFRFSND
jgi:hypothetical protein